MWARVLAAGAAYGQPESARAVLEQAATAMGGAARLQSLDNVVMTGFGQYVNQQGGSALSPDKRAPLKWTARTTPSACSTSRTSAR